MGQSYDAACAMHQQVIDDASAYIRDHPGATAEEVLAAIETAGNRYAPMLVRTALKVAHGMVPER